jgi:hypothetical protein
VTESITNWFDAIAAIFDAVDGITQVHAGGKGEDAESAVVQPQVDELTQVPAAFLGHAGINPIIQSPWQRQTHNLVGNVWLQRNPIGAQYAKAIAFIDPILVAFAAHAKGFAVETRVQSVVLESFEGITAREWPPQSNKWFLVLPFRITAQINVAQTYAAA